MRYLIILTGQDPFMTEWFEYENNYVQGMQVFDLRAFKYTDDGNTWKDIVIDHL